MSSAAAAPSPSATHPHPAPAAPTSQTSPLEALRDRQVALLSSLARLERGADLLRRQEALLASVSALEARVDGDGDVDPAGPAGCVAAGPRLPPDASRTHEVVHSDLVGRGMRDFRVRRVPPDYYDRDLEYRRRCLDAASVGNLCKSMVMENTRDDRGFPGGLPSDSDPWQTKYVMVIVQYVAKLNGDKIRDFVYDKRDGNTPRKKIKFRMAPEEVSDAITGYAHNAVSPIATKEKIPVLISHRILELQPDFFWLGAGEVDLKVRGVPALSPRPSGLVCASSSGSLPIFVS